MFHLSVLTLVTQQLQHGFCFIISAASRDLLIWGGRNIRSNYLAEHVHGGLRVHLKLADALVSVFHLVEVEVFDGFLAVLVLEGKRMPSGLPSKFSKKSRK